MNESIFKIHSIARERIHWEDHILDLSPVEKLGGLYWKREDLFAPLGYNGINGSKLRVCIWLVSEAVKQGATGIAHGAVTGSPQHPMTACIAKHFGLPVVDCIGTKNPEDHDMLQAAADMGTTFRPFNPGYAATLNSKALELTQTEFPGYFHLETNITVDQAKNPPSRVEAFHKVGSAQVQNIPDDVETMIIPAGSCNSVTSVLYGIAQYRPKNLKRLVLMGIGSFGSSDPNYIYDRMRTIEDGLEDKMKIASLFKPNYQYRPDANQDIIDRYGIKDAPYELIHYDVNGGCGACAKCKDGYCEYNDLMPYSFHHVKFHPRYEGKTLHFMQDHFNHFQQYFKQKTLFWIIGGSVNLATLKRFANA